MNKNSMIKRITATVISAALIVSAAATVNAATVEEPPLKAAVASRHTDSYRAYLNDEVEMAEDSGVKIAPYAVSGTTLQPSSALPSAYKTQTTPIRDQGSYQTCWAFSALGALEAFLSLEGRGNNDLSEQHLSWWSTSAYNSDGIGWLQNGLNSGGYSMIGAGYLASWQGAKTESALPYSGYGNSMPSNMDSEDNAYNVTGIMYVNNDIDSVKTAIYQYGGVATSYNSGSGYNDDYSSYYQANDTTIFSGHAITIIGWDDNYSKSNFDSFSQPPADGAWLVKNSWGDEVGDDGYLWISYYDRYVLDTNTWGGNFAVTRARTSNGYDKLYQNEEYGATYLTYMMDSKGNGLKTVTYANVFDFDSTHNILQNVVFQCENQGADYTVYYAPVSGNTPVTDSSKWTQIGSGTLDNTGYICVDTDNFSVPSGKGAIAVTIDASSTGEVATMGVDEWLTDANGTFLFMPDQQRNESFVIANNEVYDMVDIYAGADDDIGGTLVIKAVTTSNLIGDINNDGRISALDAFIIQRYMVGYESFSDTQLINADTNFDGTINGLDSLYIQRKVVSLMQDF